MSIWQEWRQHPERVRVRQAIFYVHLCVGAGAGFYVALMSITGSMIVYRNQLLKVFPVEWVVDLHENLLIGASGRFVNGIGAISLILLCLTGAVIWWPGINHWRRALTIQWRSHYGRFSWDTHSALGFWFFLFVLMWATSGLYFVFPQPFNGLFGVLNPSDKFTDQVLNWFTLLHFGRFGGLVQALWVCLGLVPGVLAVTGVFVCCRRMIYGSPQTRGANPEP
jgi:uncharacterized iron-regulated membrane protein